MPHSLRDRCSRALIALILVPAFCAAPLASAEIFKCVAKDATVLYQNFPCEFDSIGWVSSNPQAAKSTLMPPDASKAKPKAANVGVASTAKLANVGEPRVGMTDEEVRALLGEPENVLEDEPAIGGRISIWRYADGRSLQFDQRHRVLAVLR